MIARLYSSHNRHRLDAAYETAKAVSGWHAASDRHPERLHGSPASGAAPDDSHPCACRARSMAGRILSLADALTAEKASIHLTESPLDQTSS